MASDFSVPEVTWTIVLKLHPSHPGKGGKKSGGGGLDTGAGATFSESSKKQGGSNFPNSSSFEPCPHSGIRASFKKGTRTIAYLHRVEKLMLIAW